MSHAAFMLLLATGLIVIALAKGQSVYRKIDLDVTIFKHQPTTVSMNCSLPPNTKKCSWRMENKKVVVSSEDLPIDERYSVKMDPFLKNCYLDITAINYGDQDVYACSFDDFSPKIGWDLKIYGNPGHPVISFAGGTPIKEATIAVDDAPSTIALICTSTGANPNHKNIHWLIDGQKPRQTSVSITGSEDGTWTAVSNASFSFTEIDKKAFALKTVTCITEHVTGDSSTTKVFGIRNSDQTLHLVYDNSTHSPYGLLKCETRMFPWPIMYEIVKLKTPPSTAEEFTHQGREMAVEDDGRYICRAVITTSNGIPMYRWVDSNVIGIGVDAKCPPGTASKTQWEIILVVFNLFILYWLKTEI